MGFLQRAWETATGLGGAVQAPLGLVKDFVFEATGIEDDYDGLIDTLWSASIDRAGQVASNLFGEDRGFGAAVNAVPGAVRDPVSTVGGGAVSAINWAYEEGISQPIATALTVGSLADAPGGGGIAGLLSGENWREAYKIAQDRSPGQALALAFGTKNILDPHEVNEFVGTDLYNISSGLVDAAIQLGLAPDVFAGKALMLARTKHLVRPIRSAEQIDNYFVNKHWEKVNKFIDEVKDGKDGEALIRDRLFKGHAQGDLIAHYLRSAADSNEREKVMRLFMGDTDQITSLYANQSKIAADLEDVTRDMALVKQVHSDYGALFSNEFLLANAKHRELDIKRRFDELTDQDVDLGRLEGGLGIIGNETRLTRKSGVTQKVLRSGFYQQSVFTKPVRVFTDMRPHQVTDLHRGDASLMLERQLREAGMHQKRRDIWRERVDAATPEQRHEIFVAAEAEAFRTKAKQYGLTKGEVEEIVRNLDPQRQTAIGMLQKPKYGPDGKAKVRVNDPDGEMFETPIFETQTGNAYVMVDFRKVDKALREAGEFKARRVFGHDVPDIDFADKAVGAALRKVNLAQETMTSIMKVWKPAVLLRPAWTTRVVVLDEQLRKIAKIGALANAFDMLQGGRNLTAATMKEMFGTTDEGLLNVGKARKAGAVTGGLAGTAMAGPVGGIVGAAAGFGGLHALGKVTPAMYRQLEYNGYKVMDAAGAPDDADSIWLSKVSADDSTRQFLDVHEKGILRGLRGAGGWETITPGRTDIYAPAWERAVNDQILMDRMARQFVEGKSEQQVKDWLLTTADGAKYRKNLQRRAKNVDEWVETAKSMVDELVPDVGDIRAKALAGKRVKVADMEAAGLTEATMPNVHGQTVQQVLGQGAVVEGVRSTVNKLFTIFGTLPTDHLSRNPYFRRVYAMEMERKLSNIPAGLLKESTIRKMEDAARNTALKETRDLLYDFAERSEFADMMRNIIPFFPAYQEVLTRWAGLAVENPVFAARAYKVLSSPSELPEEGVGVAGWRAAWYKDDRGKGFLQFRLPEWAKGLVNQGIMKGAVDSQGYVRFDPKNFSMVGSGTPGFGPFVQIAASEVVKARPELEDSIKFILPFGVQGEWVDVFLPAAGKRLQSLSGEDQDRAYANAYYRIITTKLTEMREGIIDPVDMNDPIARGKFLEGVKGEVDSFFRMRFVASLVSPVAPMFDSPYQTHIDVWRKLQKENPATADERFLAEYGEEYFALTQSFTKSNNGIPPTLKGLEVDEKYGELVTRYPEFGSLIAGAEGSGLADKFSRAIYDRQLETEAVEGTGVMQRERLSPVDVATSPDVRLAWIKFSRAMDAIEAMRIERGVPNLKAKGAEDLEEAKRQIILNLAEESPGWHRAYMGSGNRDWNHKIAGLTAIANHDDLAGRPAIAGLRQYLAIRQQFLATLQQRDAAGGSIDIRSTANMDLAFAWDTAIARLASEPAFADLYNRYLHNDPLKMPMMRAN